MTLRAKEDMPDAPKVTGGGDAWEVRVDDKTVKSMIEQGKSSKLAVVLGELGRLSDPRKCNDLWSV